MIFITNDFVHKLVDDNDYEKNPEKYKGFVIVQRLYVWLKGLMTNDYLHDRFGKYGIESTKVLESTSEGLVTFSCSIRAYLAYDIEKDKWVKIASTWHQPASYNIPECNDFSADNPYKDECELMESDKSIEMETSTSTLLDLNDDCLFFLFDYCDNRSLLNLSVTCTRLEQLLKGGNYYFPNREFQLNPNESNLSITLEDAEKMLRLMGPYLTKLCLRFATESFVIDKETCLGYLRVLVKYCKRINEMILIIDIWNNDYFTILTPILENVISLKFSADDYIPNDTVTVDFTELCPNLKKIISNDCGVVHECLKKSRPSFDTFYWECGWHEISANDTLKFFKMNPQLKTFICDEFDPKELSLVAQCMPNIETLRLYISRHLNDVTTNDLLQLKKFQRLTKLKLSYCYFTGSNPKEVIEICGEFKNLLELELYFRDSEQVSLDHQQPLIALSKQLCHLEHLNLVGVQEVKEETVVDIVRFGVKLKTLHLHQCDVFATESLLKELGLIRKLIHRNLGKLNLFLDDNFQNNLFAIAAAQQYINVSRICVHRLYYETDYHVL